MNQQPVLSSARRFLIICVICIPIFIGAMDLTVVSAVLPRVIYDLELPVQSGWDDVAWMVSGYLLAYAIAMTFMGRLSDLHGRRWVFLISLAVFGFGSLLVATAQGLPSTLVLRVHYLFSSSRPDVSRIYLWVLIGARVIQAFGAGAMVPIGMALAGDLYEAGSRAKILGLIAAVDTGGWVVGHLYGGIIARFFDWRLIFWLNLPVCAIGLVLIYFLLRNLPRSLSEGKMDWPGAALISLCLTCLSIGLGSNTETTGITLDQSAILPGYALPYLGASVVFLVLFWYQQKRSKWPLIPLALFRTPNFTLANLANFLFGMSMFIAIANVPLYINTLAAANLEQGAWDSGWLLAGLTVPMALASIPGGWLTARANYRLPVVLGILLAVTGFGLMSTWKADTAYTVIIPHLILCGIGLGLTMAPLSTAILNAAPGPNRGVASSILIIFRLVGMITGVSSLATYGLHRADTLSRTLLTNPGDTAQISHVAVLVAEKVIQETFLIAAGVCVLAALPVLFLSKSHSNEVKK